MAGFTGFTFIPILFYYTLQRTAQYWLLEHLQNIFLLYNSEVKGREELHLSFPGTWWPGCATDFPHPSMADIKERVELYLYSPFVSAWQVLQGLPLSPYYLIFLHLLPQHFREVENSVSYEIYTKLFNCKQHIGRKETTEYLTNCSIMAQEQDVYRDQRKDDTEL